MNKLIQFKTIVGPILVAFVSGCFVLLPTSLAKQVEQANTALGTGALSSNTTGGFNTAIGFNCMHSNTDGFANTAVGADTLQLGTSSSSSTAIGVQALTHNNANGNTATGASALFENTSGTDNTATGVIALFSNISGNNNTADGSGALSSNTGSQNTAVGYNSLVNNTSGDSNIAVGFEAGIALITGDNNIDIGNAGVFNEGNTIRIGTQGTQIKTFVAGIRGVTTGVVDAVNVVIDSAGQLGTVSSSRRFKNEIKAMDRTSEAILALKPVTFHYKSDTKGTPQFGLIAEEVAEISPDLVVRDDKGEIYTVRYDAVNAMLLNEFLKEHRKVEALQASFAQQQKDFQATVAQQQKQIEALTAGLQKVSAQLEASKPAPQLVANGQ